MKPGVRSKVAIIKRGAYREAHRRRWGWCCSSRQQQWRDPIVRRHPSMCSSSWARRLWRQSDGHRRRRGPTGRWWTGLRAMRFARGGEPCGALCRRDRYSKIRKTGANGRSRRRGKRGSDGASAAPRVRESRGLSSLLGFNPRRPDKISGDTPVQADRRPTGRARALIGHTRSKVAPASRRMSLSEACATDEIGDENLKYRPELYC